MLSLIAIMTWYSQEICVRLTQSSLGLLVRRMAVSDYTWPDVHLFIMSNPSCIYDILNRIFARKIIIKSQLMNVPYVQETEEPLSQDFSVLEICFLVSMATYVSLDSCDTVARLS